MDTLYTLKIMYLRSNLSPEEFLYLLRSSLAQQLESCSSCASDQMEEALSESQEAF